VELRRIDMHRFYPLSRTCSAAFCWPVFVTERGAAFTRDGVAKLIARAGAAAGFGFRVHPHMLRHACGFALAKAGHDTRRLQDYLGHKSINSTVRYTELDASKFWRD
jgi:site-specific recombinase XerD